MIRIEIQDEIKNAPRLSLSIREAIEESYEGSGKTTIDELEIRLYRHDYEIDELENIPKAKRTRHIIYKRLAK